MNATLAGTDLPPSAVHTMVEIGAKGALTAAELCDILMLEKSSISRMVRKLIEAGELIEAASDKDGRAKPLSLTPKGRETLAAIHRFAQDQVIAALENLDTSACKVTLDGLAAYAGALHQSRTGIPATNRTQVTIETGYRPGLIGRAVEMHARYYSHAVGFGRFFESRIAAGLSDFVSRMDNPCNGLWVALRGGEIVGTVAIDGQDLAPDVAHLRWFIVADGLRGAGIGRALLTQALRFCDQQGFLQTHLWTFRGLDAARRLYERNKFSLAEEMPGTQWGREVIEQKFVRKSACGTLQSPITARE
jgi:DNA-binding MarR family transcriptional regulator/GNAT superfamily N-acetyltransferase